MESNRNKQEAKETAAAALDDDALNEVSGGCYHEYDIRRGPTPGYNYDDGCQYGKYWCENRDWEIKDFTGNRDRWKVCPVCGGETFFTNGIYLGNE